MMKKHNWNNDLTEITQMNNCNDEKNTIGIMTSRKNAQMNNWNDEKTQSE